MSSLPSSRNRFKLFGATVLAGLVALFVGNSQAHSQLIPSANGAQTFLSAPVALTAAAPSTNISVASVNGSSGLFDANGVLTLSNSNAAAQTITYQYMVNGSAVGPVVSTTLAAGASSTTVAVPQQLAVQPASSAVSLHIVNTTGGAGVTVGTGSGVTVTGYANNLIPTATGPGSSNLAATTNNPLPAGTLTVSVPAVASAQGFYSLNSALSITNLTQAALIVTANYTVDGVNRGSTFQVNLAASGATMLALPTQLSGLGAGAHNIGIALTSNGGNNSISIGAGSSLSATSYNATGTTVSATGTTVANLGTGLQTQGVGGAWVPPSNQVGAPFAITVPTNATAASFYDANAVLMLSSNTNGAPITIQAQYLVGATIVNNVITGGTLMGPVFTTTLAGSSSGSATLYMPEEFSASQLAPGTTLAVELMNPFGTASFNIDADSLTLVAHNLVPPASTPEPASMSLAAMAMMAFGAAAYRKRKAAKVKE